MEVGPVGSASQAPVEAPVRVPKGAGKQLESVVYTILSGVEQTSDAIAKTTGRILDVVA